MKLVDKFTLWFISVIVITTPITSYICLNNIEKKIDDVEIARLKAVNEHTAARLGNGIAPGQLRDTSPTVVTQLAALPNDSVLIRKDPDPDGNRHSLESRLTVNSYYTVNGKHYQVTSSSYIPASRQILNAILDTVAWKLLLIILCVALSARFLSQHILHTLRQTMKKIHNFDLKKKIAFPETNTVEFKELNTFLKKMTDKAVDEYTAVKEFSENASHELQTPLAVLRGKLELLSESDIDEGQAALIADMHHAVEKLSKINRSLILLSKLENNEFAVSEHIKFCRVAKDVLAAYEDRLEMKNIEVKRNLDKNILLKIHPVLADMLMNNLLGNAIRHNIQDGTIDIILTHKKLVIKNTGLPPETPPEELFERFRKSNQCSESVGLGLAIVKQICEVCDFRVSYRYKAPLHILQVDFCPDSVIDEALQDKFEAAEMQSA
ncbi:HAMP domain-containing sensor histidine kinase [Chitinophaga sp. HK235]|uniref:sensor histidine kinase n=1 Tax=Chitinophaga sp. HK235 TaxID=2952571 RepID=UPI001BADA225|nr:HAMP domain-containing sensor histidine kinase [Chitinophaga sp. HK235]